MIPCCCPTPSNVVNLSNNICSLPTTFTPSAFPRFQVSLASALMMLFLFLTSLSDKDMFVALSSFPPDFFLIFFFPPFFFPFPYLFLPPPIFTSISLNEPTLRFLGFPNHGNSSTSSDAHKLIARFRVLRKPN